MAVLMILPAPFSSHNSVVRLFKLKESEKERGKEVGSRSTYGRKGI